MGWFQRLSVRAKLLLSFSTVCAIMGVVGYVGLTKMSAINEMVSLMYNSELKGISLIKDAAIEVPVIGREARQLIVETDATKMNLIVAEIENRAQSFRNLSAEAENTFYLPEGRAKVAAARQAFEEFYLAILEVSKCGLANDKDAADVKMQELLPIGARVNAALAEACQFKDKVAEGSFEQAGVTYASARNLMLGVIAGGVVVGLALGYFISRWFTKAILEVDEIANGVAAAAQQLAAASEQLSSGAQESASSLEETASSLEEITATVRQNADSADQANQMASGARETAEKGGAVVNNAVKAMAEINQASKKIADIITTIDEIAFQTNLLALNAAVEAARAGEQGRGFAVVAGEVRNLAQRSATAAKEIKGLIEDSVQKVETGSQLVNQSGDTLEAIVTSVKRVTDIVAEIAAASREQSVGIDQVNKAMTQMDQVTQANASQTEEMSGTAVALSQQADQLQSVVAQFNVRNQEVARKPAKRPRVAAKPVPAPVDHFHAPAKPAAKKSKPAKPAASRNGHAVTNGEVHELDLVGVGASGDGFEEF